MPRWAVEVEGGGWKAGGAEGLHRRVKNTSGDDLIVCPTVSQHSALKGVSVMGHCR